MQYENTFKAIDQILWKESGCSSELDYLEQKSWLLFLKYPLVTMGCPKDCRRQDRRYQRHDGQRPRGVC